MLKARTDPMGEETPKRWREYAARSSHNQPPQSSPVPRHPKKKGAKGQPPPSNRAQIDRSALPATVGLYGEGHPLRVRNGRARPPGLTILIERSPGQRPRMLTVGLGWRPECGYGHERN